MARRRRRKAVKPEAAISVWQPVGFNPCDYLPRDLHKYEGYARFYVGMIIEHTRHDRKEKREKRWARLSHRTAKCFFPDTKTYKAVKDALITHGAIECDEDYEIGLYSKGYRLGKVYEHARICEVKIRGKPALHLEKKLRTSRARYHERLDDVCGHLLTWLLRVRVSRYAVVELNASPRNHDSYRMQLKRLDCLSSHRSTCRFALKKCAYGRIHTPVTCGWKGFRRFLTVNGCHLVGLDVRNSQPLMLGLVLRAISRNGRELPDWLTPPVAERITRYLDLSPAEVHGEPAKESGSGGQSDPGDHRQLGQDIDRLQSLESKESDGSFKKTSTPQPPNTSVETQENDLLLSDGLPNCPYGLMTCVEISDIVDKIDVEALDRCLPGTGDAELIPHTPETLETLEGEVERYVKLCECGRFYDWMMERLRIPPAKRSGFKTKFFINVMFGKPQRSCHSEEWKLFARCFPHIAKLICEIKNEDGHPALARLLQRVESSLMINRVCRRLMKEHAEVPVLTIHDSILTTRKFVPLVRQVIEEEFARLGLQPQLNLEEYGRHSSQIELPRVKCEQPSSPGVPVVRTEGDRSQPASAA